MEFNGLFFPGAGKPNAEYCRWIQDPQRWGGAIELSILSEHYKREIAAYDIQTGRCDCYGQGRGYTQRAMLLYDGLHYDAMAVQSAPGAAEATDITLTPVTGELAGAYALHVSCCRMYVSKVLASEVRLRGVVPLPRIAQYSLRHTQPLVQGVFSLYTTCSRLTGGSGVRVAVDQSTRARGRRRRWRRRSERARSRTRTTSRCGAACVSRGSRASRRRCNTPRTPATAASASTSFFRGVGRVHTPYCLNTRLGR